MQTMNAVADVTRFTNERVATHDTNSTLSVRIWLINPFAA